MKIPIILVKDKDGKFLNVTHKGWNPNDPDGKEWFIVHTDGTITETPIADQEEMLIIGNTGPIIHDKAP